MTRSLFLVAVFVFSSCLDTAAIPESPSDLDAALHQLWNEYSTATDDTVRAQAQTLSSAGDVAGLTSARRYNLRRLEKSELAVVQMRDDADPSTARGTVMINSFACTLERLDDILTATNQQDIFAATYDAFAREDTSDPDAYAARTAPTLSWTTSYEAKLNDAPYAAVTNGTMRYVPAASGQLGPLLLARTWLPTPATFFDDRGDAYPQDYQVEVFWERGAGEIAHVYAVWREMKLVTANLTSNDNALTNLMIERLKEWDVRTAQICAK